jgi:hypothetical protein
LKGGIEHFSGLYNRLPRRRITKEDDGDGRSASNGRGGVKLTLLRIADRAPQAVQA